MLPSGSRGQNPVIWLYTPDYGLDYGDDTSAAVHGADQLLRRTDGVQVEDIS